MHVRVNAYAAVTALMIIQQITRKRKKAYNNKILLLVNRFIPQSKSKLRISKKLKNNKDNKNVRNGNKRISQPLAQTRFNAKFVIRLYLSIKSKLICLMSIKSSHNAKYAASILIQDHLRDISKASINLSRFLMESIVSSVVKM